MGRAVTGERISNLLLPEDFQNQTNHPGKHLGAVATEGRPLLKGNFCPFLETSSLLCFDSPVSKTWHFTDDLSFTYIGKWRCFLFSFPSGVCIYIYIPCFQLAQCPKWIFKTEDSVVSLISICTSFTTILFISSILLWGNSYWIILVLVSVFSALFDDNISLYNPLLQNLALLPLHRCTQWNIQKPCIA